MIQLFSGLSVFDRYLNKIYQKRVFPVPQRYSFNRGIRIDLMRLSIKPVCNCFAGYSFYPFIQGFMGVRFTDKNEITFLVQNFPAEWFMTVQIIADKRYFQCLIG